MGGEETILHSSRAVFLTKYLKKPDPELHSSFKCHGFVLDKGGRYLQRAAFSQNLISRVKLDSWNLTSQVH